jgi:CelD/BcsL family acetyltransferase involved in cellulose biosynthesis
MSVERLNDLSMPGLAEQWNALAGAVPFRSFEWLSNWWKVYQPGWTSMRREVELYTLAVYDGQTPIAILPCYLERSRTAGRVVQFLGARETCSDFLGVLCKPGAELTAVNELADWLADASRKSGPACDRWDILQLNGVDAADPLMARLIEQLHLRGLATAARAKDRTWRIELPSTWEKYLELLSKSHRKQLRQRQRRAFDSGQVQLCTAGPSESIEYGWNILTDLHQRRLESLGKAGCFASSVYKEFHRSATIDLFAAGMLRLHWIEVDGQPVAAEYHLHGGDVVFAYQGGVDPGSLDHEPGRLATMATVKLAIENGFRGFDFCRGDEPYKAHWRATPRESLEWRVVSNHAAAKVRDCVWVAGEGARRFIKGGLNLAGHKRNR